MKSPPARCRTGTTRNRKNTRVWDRRVNRVAGGSGIRPKRYRTRARARPKWRARHPGGTDRHRR